MHNNRFSFIRMRQQRAHVVNAAALQVDIASRFNLTSICGTNLRAQHCSKSNRKTRQGETNITSTPAHRSIVKCPCCCNVPTDPSRSSCSVCGFFLISSCDAIVELSQIRVQSRAAPTTPLFNPFSKQDWEDAEQRLEAREGSHCPICMAGFSQSHELLLSCSHAFHRTCLDAFERFMKKSDKLCPVCR